MNKNLFRKSSIDRLNSPEQLNSYIQVAKPSVWILLAAIVCLLIGVVVWGYFGVIDTKVETGAIAQNGTVVSYCSPEDAEKMAAGMKVTVNGIEGVVKGVESAPIQVDDTFDTSLLYLCNLEQNNFCYAVELEIHGLSDGIYKASIIVDSISPISFIIH